MLIVRHSHRVGDTTVCVPCDDELVEPDEANVPRLDAEEPPAELSDPPLPGLEEPPAA